MLAIKPRSLARCVFLCTSFARARETTIKLSREHEQSELKKTRSEVGEREREEYIELPLLALFIARAKTYKHTHTHRQRGVERYNQEVKTCYGAHVRLLTADRFILTTIGVSRLASPQSAQSSTSESEIFGLKTHHMQMRSDICFDFMAF